MVVGGVTLPNKMRRPAHHALAEFAGMDATETLQFFKAEPRSPRWAEEPRCFAEKMERFD